MQEDAPPSPHKLLLPRVMHSQPSPVRPSLNHMMHLIQQKRSEYEKQAGTQEDDNID